MMTLLQEYASLLQEVLTEMHVRVTGSDLNNQEEKLLIYKEQGGKSPLATGAWSSHVPLAIEFVIAAPGHPNTRQIYSMKDLSLASISQQFRLVLYRELGMEEGS